MKAIYASATQVLNLWLLWQSLKLNRGATGETGHKNKFRDAQSVTEGRLSGPVELKKLQPKQAKRRHGLWLPAQPSWRKGGEQSGTRGTNLGNAWWDGRPALGPGAEIQKTESGWDFLQGREIGRMGWRIVSCCWCGFLHR